MQFSDQDKAALDNAILHANGDMRKAVELAFEAGLLEGAMRAARSIAAASQQQGNDQDDDRDTPLTSSDRAALQRLGVDPDKKFRIRNSLFTITGYKASRWKYPISAQTQNGTKYKFTVDQVKLHQK
jgi:hypothetical protein